MKELKPFDSIVAEFISHLKKLNISHRKLAREIELPHTTVVNILNRKSGGTYTNITKIQNYISNEFIHHNKKHPDKPLPISRYSKQKPVFLLQTDKISKAKKIMDDEEFDTIPILVRKGHRIVGRVTHPYVYGAGYKNDQVQIKTIMKPAPTIVPDTTPDTIVKEMLKKMRWDCIILQKKGEYVGIITYWDVL